MTRPNFDGACSSEFIVLTPTAAINGNFLKYLLHSRTFVNFAARSVSGDRPRVDFAEIARHTVNLPPLAEQERIVRKIDELLARVRRGEVGLRKVLVRLILHRQSTLKAAIAEGSALDHDFARGNGFSIGQIGTVVTGTTPPTTDDDNYDGNIPFVKPTDLDNGYHVDSAREFLSEKGAALSRRLPARSVLVTCIGATIGKTGLSRFECATNQQINAILPDPGKVLPEWLFWVMCSPYGQHAIRMTASATTLPILNKSKFSAIRVPIPSVDDQRRLVHRIERDIEVNAALKSQVQVSLNLLRGEQQSILTAAFCGELVPQDPSDESAEILLERIRRQQTLSAGSIQSSISKRRKTT